MNPVRHTVLKHAREDVAVPVQALAKEAATILVQHTVLKYAREDVAVPVRQFVTMNV